MKNSFTNRFVESGQVLVLVVLMIFAIIAMVALILDGGDIMSNRRTAQAAADAGALAGAQTLCMGNPNPIGVAESYAIGNGANTAVVTLNESEKSVTVVTTVENPSFFARIFNEDTLVATADATANCFFPSIAERVLPIAFYYEKAPLNSDEEDCTQDGICNLVAKDFDELMEALDSTPIVTPGLPGEEVNLPLDDIYIISESIKVCEKPDTGPVVCADVFDKAGGARTFVDLSDLIAPPGGLAKIIQNGLDDPLLLPAWVSTQGAVNDNVYNRDNYTVVPPITGYEDMEARIFFVPVFDLFCSAGDPRYNLDTCDYDFVDEYPNVEDQNIQDDNYDYMVNPNTAVYRMVGFAPFVLTGVTKNEVCTFGEAIPYDPWDGIWNLGTGTIEFGKNAEPCPGWAKLKVELDAAGEYTSAAGSAIEGYFASEFPADQYIWGTGGVDVGIYLISLSE